ncbi:MAG: DUF5675 family protein [Puia sp.]
MELELIRTYYTGGTNGKIFLRDSEAAAQESKRCLMMYSIELPWKDNHAGVSCIPEGRYELVQRWSPRFRRHLQVMDVAQRKYILIHPANDAMHELKGCIAPASFITGVGKGIRSRLALDILTSLVYGALDQHDQVFINIKSESYEFD